MKMALLDAHSILERVAERIPDAVRSNIVVIGSIAAAWAFRDVSGTASVATKDIDLLLRPSIDAVVKAEEVGRALFDAGWEPNYPQGWSPASASTPEDQLPALRLSPPAGDPWFVEFLAEPTNDQQTRKHWRRMQTDNGHFGLPSFRYMRVAVHDAERTPFGLHVVRPASMALANLLEHAQPDRTEVRNLGQPRYVKDVGRSVALWWLAQQRTVPAADAWLSAWRNAFDALYPGRSNEYIAAAALGLESIASRLQDAHSIAVRSLLAPHGTTLAAYRRAYAGLNNLLADASGTPILTADR
jgi:hypothetical protein